MPPRIASSVRRAEIMDAAMRCLQRTGYRKLSMDDIVKESGLSKGTIYWHFKNKKELFITLFEGMLNQAVTGFTPLLSNDMPASEKLYSILSSVSQVADEELQFASLPLTLITELLNDDDFIERYQTIINNLAEEIMAIIQQGIDTGEFKEVDTFEAAWAFMSAYDGLLLYHAINMPGNVQKQNQIIAELIVAGLKK